MILRRRACWRMVMEQRTSIARQEVGGAPNGDQGVGIAAAVGPHRELSLGPSVAHATHRLTQAVLAWPSRSRDISTSPAPVVQARASNSRLTRSNWRICPHRKLRRKVPRVDGALTT